METRYVQGFATTRPDHDGKEVKEGNHETDIPKNEVERQLGTGTKGVAPFDRCWFSRTKFGGYFDGVGPYIQPVHRKIHPERHETQ